MQQYKEKTKELLNCAELKTIFSNISSIVIISLTTCGRKAWQEDEETRKDFNIVLTHQDKKFFTSEHFQSHSGRSPIDPTLQDNVLIPNNVFQYIYHVGCAINLHSIINSGLIAGGPNLNNRQIVFLLVDPMDKNIRILIRMEETSEYCFLGRHQSGSEERIEVLSNTIERYHSLRYTPQLIVSRKLSGWKLEKSYAKQFSCHLDLHQRSPWNMTRWKNWVQKMLNDQRDKLCHKSSRWNQPIPSPDHDRKGQPVVGTDRTVQPVDGTNPRIESSGRKTFHSQEIETRSFHEEAVKHDRTWRIRSRANNAERDTTQKRIIVSANQLSLYGPVAEMCEEYESFQDRTGQSSKAWSRQKCFWIVMTFLTLMSLTTFP